MNSRTLLLHHDLRLSDDKPTWVLLHTSWPAIRYAEGNEHQRSTLIGLLAVSEGGNQQTSKTSIRCIDQHFETRQKQAKHPRFGKSSQSDWPA